MAFVRGAEAVTAPVQGPFLGHRQGIQRPRICVAGQKDAENLMLVDAERRVMSGKGTESNSICQSVLCFALLCSEQGPALTVRTLRTREP